MSMFENKTDQTNRSSVIERSIENDCRPFGNRTFDYVRLTKFYCEFDYVRLPNLIERVVFDWFDYRTFEEIRRAINYTDGGSANCQ